MLPEGARIAEVEVDVVAALGAQGDVAALQVFVAKHLFDGGQAVSAFVGQLGLQPGHDEVGARRAVAPRGSRAGGADEVAAVLVYRHGARHVLAVVLAEGGEVPPLAGHQPVGQSGNVLPRPFSDGFRLLLLGQQGGVVAAEGVQHVVEGECLCLVQPVVQGEGGVPVVVVGARVLVRLFAGGVLPPALSPPVVFVPRGVHVGGGVAVVVGRQHEVQPPQQQVALAVLR